MRVCLLNDTLIGAGILAIAGLILFLKLKDSIDVKRKLDAFTVGFMIFSFALFIYSSFIIGKSAIESTQVCDILPLNETVNGSTTSYNYANVCFNNDDTSAVGLFKLSNLMIIISGLFLTLISLWTIIHWILELYHAYK